MRRTYRFDAASGRVREVVAGSACRSGALSCPTVRREIPAYRSPVTGRRIETRADRAVDLKAAGCVDARDLK